MNVEIKNVERMESDLKCMFCEWCNIESVFVKAIINHNKEHILYFYSCPACPNITFEFSGEEDLAVMSEYLLRT